MAEHRRITIMDGEVVAFADSFTATPGVLGDINHANGPFEVSASRNAVMVHRAWLESDEAVERFIAVIREAQAAARTLTRERWGGNYKITPPQHSQAPTEKP